MTDSEKDTPSSGESQPDEDDHEGSGALNAVTEVVKEASQESVPVLADVALDSLFSDALRARLLQEAEQGLHDLIDAALRAIPASASYGQLHGEMDKAERQLQAMLREAIDEIFSGSGRARLQRHMEQAAREIPEGGPSAAKDEAGQALEALLSEILDVMQRHWAESLRLLLGITAKALEATFTSHVKEAFASITARPAEELEEKVEPLQEKLAAKAEELRERLIETRDTMQERLVEARDEIQDRLGSGMPGAATGSRRQTRFGSPPSRRPPPGPTGNQRPGMAPRGRPPSASR